MYKRQDYVYRRSKLKYYMIEEDNGASVTAAILVGRRRCTRMCNQNFKALIRAVLRTIEESSSSQ